MAEPIPESELELFRQQWRVEVGVARSGGNRSTAGAMALGPPVAPPSPDKPPSDGAARSPPPATRRRLSAVVARSPERSQREPTTATSPRSYQADLAAVSPFASPESATSSLPSVRSPPRAAHQPLAVRGSAQGDKPEHALAIYQQAIDAEQAHQLSAAVNLYARAFRLDDRVDKEYQRLHGQHGKAFVEAAPGAGSGAGDAAQAAAGSSMTNGAAAAAEADDDLVFRFQRQFHVGPDYDFSAPTPADAAPHRSSLIHGGAELHAAIAADGSGARFEPDDEALPLLLARVPDEVLVVILGKLGELGDMAGIGRFAQTSRKAFMLSVEQGLWKHLCELVYQPPFVVPPEYKTSVAVRDYAGDHRDMLLRQPRVRMDGLYISVVHYVRVGSSDTLWTDPVHMITYHRLIRFLADGTMLSLLSTEHPSVLVPLLTPSLRMQGLHQGRWSLSTVGTAEGSPDQALIGVTDLGEPADDGGADQAAGAAEPGAVPVHPREARRRAAARAKGRKYEFEMVLGLGSTSRGRWNKLVLRDYFSTNKQTGEQLPIKLVNQGPFFFSRVRSYHPWGQRDDAPAA